MSDPTAEAVELVQTLANADKLSRIFTVMGPIHPSIRAALHAAIVQIYPDVEPDAVLGRWADTGESLLDCVRQIRAELKDLEDHATVEATEAATWKLAETLAATQFGMHVARWYGSGNLATEPSVADLVYTTLTGVACPCGRRHVDPDPDQHWSDLSGCTVAIPVYADKSRTVLCGRPMAVIHDDVVHCTEHDQQRTALMVAGNQDAAQRDAVRTAFGTKRGTERF